MTAETTGAVLWPNQGPHGLLRAHGWTKAAYCETFGLERGQPLEGQEPGSAGQPRSQPA